MNDEQIKTIEAALPEGIRVEAVTTFGGTDERVQITLAPIPADAPEPGSVEPDHQLPVPGVDAAVDDGREGMHTFADESKP